MIEAKAKGNTVNVHLYQPIKSRSSVARPRGLPVVQYIQGGPWPLAFSQPQWHPMMTHTYPATPPPSPTEVHRTTSTSTMQMHAINDAQQAAQATLGVSTELAPDQGVGNPLFSTSPVPSKISIDHSIIRTPSLSSLSSVARPQLSATSHAHAYMPDDIEKLRVKYNSHLSTISQDPEKKKDFNANILHVGSRLHALLGDTPQTTDLKSALQRQKYGAASYYDELH